MRLSTCGFRTSIPFVFGSDRDFINADITRGMHICYLACLSNILEQRMFIFHVCRLLDILEKAKTLLSLVNSLEVKSWPHFSPNISIRNYIRNDFLPNGIMKAGFKHKKSMSRKRHCLHKGNDSKLPL